jgi:hypothetical protein
MANITKNAYMVEKRNKWIIYQNKTNKKQSKYDSTLVRNMANMHMDYMLALVHLCQEQLPCLHSLALYVWLPVKFCKTNTFFLLLYKITFLTVQHELHVEMQIGSTNIKMATAPHMTTIMKIVAQRRRRILPEY